LFKKNCLLFSAVISEHFSKNRVVISVVAAKIWYLKNVLFLLGYPVHSVTYSDCQISSTLTKHCGQNDMVLTAYMLLDQLLEFHPIKLSGLFTDC